MIGVDTNVLIRAVLDDTPKEADIAKKFLKIISDKKKLFISSYAILEMVWVLKVKGRTRLEICESIFALLDAKGIIVGQREIVVSALERYKKGKADFGDYLILAEGEANYSPKMASFDKALCKDNSQCQHPSTFLTTINH